MDPRIRERRVEVARRQGRRRLTVLVGLTAVTVLTGAGFAIVHSPLLEVRHVIVEGSAHTPARLIESRAGLSGHPLMVSVDRGLIARRVEHLPWVRSAEVIRSWPSTVKVRIVERTPVAQVESGQGWAVVDGTGRVLERSGAPVPGLVALTGVGSPGAPGGYLGVGSRPALAVASSLPQTLTARVSGVGAVGGGGIVLSLTGSATVELGDASGLSDKFEALDTVMSRVDLRGVKVIDVRVPQDPVLTRG